MKPSCSTIGRTYRAQPSPRGHHNAMWPLASGATTVPSGSVPDGLAPTVTTGGTYSIGSAVTPEARLLMSSSKGTVRSSGTPSGVKKAPYASPVTCAVAITSNCPVPYACVVVSRSGNARSLGKVRTEPSPKSIVQRWTRTELGTTNDEIASSIQLRQPAVSSAVTVRSLPDGAVTGST